MTGYPEESLFVIKPTGVGENLPALAGRKD